MCDQDIQTRRARDLERYHRRVAEHTAKGLCLKCRLRLQRLSVRAAHYRGIFAPS